MKEARHQAGEVTQGSAKSNLIEHYDARYAHGGFGYRDRRPYWLEWSRLHYLKEFGLRAGETLLDVGCGDGFWTGLFAELGLRSTGIDISPGGIAVAKALEPRTPFLVADADLPLPFASESFDIVFCRAITQLARHDLLCEENRRFVAGLMSYVAPGGMLLISYSTTRRGGGPPEHPHHCASDLVRLLEVAGDPFHLDLVGNALQLAAQRWDAPRSRRDIQGSLIVKHPWRIRAAQLLRRAIFG